MGKGIKRRKSKQVLKTAGYSGKEARKITRSRVKSSKRKRYKSRKQLKKEGLMGEKGYIASSFEKATRPMQIKQIIHQFSQNAPLSASTHKTTGKFLPTPFLKANQPELVFGGKIERKISPPTQESRVVKEFKSSNLPQQSSSSLSLSQKQKSKRRKKKGKKQMETLGRFSIQFKNPMMHHRGGSR